MYYSVCQNRCIEPNISWRKEFCPNSEDRNSNKNDTHLIAGNAKTHTCGEEQLGFFMERNSQYAAYFCVFISYFIFIAFWINFLFLPGIHLVSQLGSSIRINTSLRPKWTWGNYINAGRPSFLMKANRLKWLSKPPLSRKKMVIGMSNVKCYYRNSKCNPSLVPVYHISVSKGFLLWKKKKKSKHFRYIKEPNLQ